MERIAWGGIQGGNAIVEAYDIPASVAFETFAIDEDQGVVEVYFTIQGKPSAPLASWLPREKSGYYNSLFCMMTCHDIYGFETAPSDGVLELRVKKVPTGVEVSVSNGGVAVLIRCASCSLDKCKAHID